VDWGVLGFAEALGRGAQRRARARSAREHAKRASVFVCFGFVLFVFDPKNMPKPGFERQNAGSPWF
jgi:hypothetical protein